MYFFKREVKYLGRIISKDGYHSDPPKMTHLRSLDLHQKPLANLGFYLAFLVIAILT